MREQERGIVLNSYFEQAPYSLTATMQTTFHRDGFNHKTKKAILKYSANVVSRTAGITCMPGSGLPELARQLPFPHFPNLSENLTQLA